MYIKKSRFKRSSSYDHANFISRFIFAYIYPTFIRGIRNNGLSINDIHRCSKSDKVEKITTKLIENWEFEKHKKKPRFGWVIFRTYWTSFLFPLVIYLFNECFLRIVQSLLLGRLIRYFSNDPSVNYKWACIYAGGVCLCNLLLNSLQHPNVQTVMRKGMHIRTACCSLMYQKVLKLSRASMAQTAVGQIVNIMSNDVNRFDNFSNCCCYLLVAPLQAAIVMYIVWGYLGASSLLGLGLLLLFIPFQLFMGKLFSSARSTIASLTDNRLKFMNEIIAGIRVIKMYNWETPFTKRVSNARKKEVSHIQKANYLRALNLSLFIVATRTILFACFVLFVLLGNTLTAENVFVSISLFNLLRMNITLMFPQCLSLLGELQVSVKRIQTFLLLEEIAPQKVQENVNLCTRPDTLRSNKKTKTELCLKAEHVKAQWNSKDGQLTLDDISVDLNSGDLLAIVGKVGSGKSSFLMCLLNELSLKSGNIQVKGSISYASQDSWSFNDSVRNNILFGLEYDEARYNQVVEMCALKRDFQLMLYGDRTLVGEKGVSLSGGQKARINLARAVYRNADIYLLDDPLSAVDTAVAKHIFDNCIMTHLEGKIRILVTHQIQFLEKATKILILEEGKCLAYGTYSEIQQMGINLSSMLPYLKKTNKLHEANSSNVNSKMIGATVRISTPSIGQLKQNSNENITEPDKGNGPRNANIKIQEEQLQHGSINCRIYKEYLRAGGGIFLMSSMIIFSIISQSIFHGSDLFLTYWTNKNQLLSPGEKPDKSEQYTDIYIYTGMIVALFFTTIFRSFSFFMICMRASVNLHNSIIARLVRAPVDFFDTNSAGRILNRFAKDLGIIDESIPNTGFDLNFTIGQAIGIVITVSIVNYYLVIPAIVIAIIVVNIRAIYIKAARDIKRFDGLVRSPVYAHVSNTIDGLAIIRAYGVQEAFKHQFSVYQNDHSATWFMYLSASRALGMLMDWITTLYIIIITIVIMLSDIPGGDAGLAISSGLMLAGVTQFGIRQSAEFESQMTAVERIVEYQDLEQEAPENSSKKSKTTTRWPATGAIQFDHVSLAYGKDSSKFVLKNINCTINAGEKVGIVGRTGAGKSSLITALFRLTEPDGVIRIDGVNIRSIGLHDLRTKISIIPQDPVVFSGTVRYNLDPFDEYSDSELWSALEAVQLKKQIDNFSEKLESKLSINGGNLSVGQRQLICLARAVLRRNKILILDEATANVDHQTDLLIQKTIKTEFHSCTVLTVAHRLNTIMDCDRVLVLDAGEVVEFDTPYKLLKNRQFFYEMCKKTEEGMFEHLFQIAKNNRHEKVVQLSDKFYLNKLISSLDLAITKTIANQT